MSANQHILTTIKIIAIVYRKVVNVEILEYCVIGKIRLFLPNV